MNLIEVEKPTHLGSEKDVDLDGEGTEQNDKGKVESFDVFGGSHKMGKARGSLQDAFMKFKKKRQEDMRLIRGMKERTLLQMKDPDHMWDLRMKFLARAKHYYGVPYAKRYHGPDSPDHNAPLFLDCCGLVRRILLDLRDDFGFKVGLWNQAYQYDTLPITIEKEEDMKPGDLVFISAIYHNPKSKKQRHDMVHVEIWAGEGSQSIGARWQKGHVQMFDSYKFEAKSYHSMVYHFKSIDTWLQGICMSHCAEHLWVITKYQPGQKSIFALGKHSEDEGEAAEDCSEEMDDEEHPDDQMPCEERERFIEEGNETRDVNIEAKNGQTEQNHKLTAEEQPQGNHDSNLDVNYNRLDSNLLPTSDISDDVDFEEDVYQTFDEGSNKDHLNLETLRGCDSCQNVTEPQDGDDGEMKESQKEAPRKKSRSTSDQSSSQRTNGGRGKDDASDGRPRTITSPRSLSMKEIGPAFYIGGANGVALVEGPLLSKGWHRIYDRTSENFKLKWVELKSHINYNSFRRGEQLVNRIPNTGHLATKVGLLETLREYSRVNERMQRSRSSRVLKTEDFFPESYNLDNKADREMLYQAHKDGDVWISKPNSMNQGKGIYLVKDLTDIQRKYQQAEESGRTVIPRKGTHSRIIQRYIPNPMLLDGKKFDVRAYMLIACTTPYIVFYHPGYLRLSCDAYDSTSDDLALHLTNQFVQKKNPGYQDMKEDTVWSMDRFNDHVNTLAKDKGLPRDWVFNQFTKRMTQIMTHCFMAVKNKLQCKLGYFDLLGFDFLLDDSMKVFLLEVNVNPALHTNCETLRNQIPPIVHETLDVVLEIFEKCRHSRPIMPLASQRKLTLLYSDTDARQTSRHVSHSTSPPRGQGSPVRTGSPTRGVRSRSTSPAKRQRATMTSLRKNVTKMSINGSDTMTGGAK